MRYLSPREVLYIHFAVAEGSGVRDVGLLESALARPRSSAARSSAGGEEAYPSIFEKAAVLLDSICGNHPFVDGNKRTAITTASIFLSENGYEVTATNNELEEFTLLVARTKPDIGEIAKWFEDHTSRAEDPAGGGGS